MKHTMIPLLTVALLALSAAPSVAAEASGCAFGPYYHPNPGDDKVQQRDGVCAGYSQGGNVAVGCLVTQQEIYADYVQGSTESGACVLLIGLDGATCAGYTYSETDYNGDTSFEDDCSVGGNNNDLSGRAPRVPLPVGVGLKTSADEQAVLRGACLIAAEALSNEDLADECVDVFNDANDVCWKYLFHTQYTERMCYQLLGER